MFAVSYIDANEPNVIVLDHKRFDTRAEAEWVRQDAALRLPQYVEHPEDFTLQIRQRKS